MTDKARKLGEEPAFPYAVREDTEAWSGGMTKREYFAALAMPHITEADVPSKIVDCEKILGLEKGTYDSSTHWPVLKAKHAVIQADALLEQLAKEEV